MIKFYALILQIKVSNDEQANYHMPSKGYELRKNYYNKLKKIKFPVQTLNFRVIIDAKI